MEQQDKLFTCSFIMACIGNFLLFFGFYLLLPTLPLYMIDRFGLPNSTIGIILSCYTVAALFIRPFSAFLADMFSRKPVYLIAFFFFVLLFVSYPLVATVGAFLLMRILHGLAFGAVTTSGNTLIVDIMPSSRRGEGLGYFGMSNNLAMATGPMVGLMMVDALDGDFTKIFYSAMFIGTLGFLCACTIRAPRKPRVAQQEKISLDRFFLKKGLVNGLCLLLLGVPYAVTTSYVAIYAQEVGVTSGMGYFFSLLAVGMIVSRLFAGKVVDQGGLTKVISIGSVVVTLAFFLFSLAGKLENPFIPHVVLFYFVALSLGVGYGMMFPAYNTLFVSLAPHNRRATASSTYLTSWDIGVGGGLVVGGALADIGGLSLSFFVGALSTLASSIVFITYGANYYLKNKLQ